MNGQSMIGNSRNSRAKKLANYRAPLGQTFTSGIQPRSKKKPLNLKTLGLRSKPNLKTTSQPKSMKYMIKKAPLISFGKNKGFQSSTKQNRVNLADVSSSIAAFQQQKNTTYKAPLMGGGATLTPSTSKKPKPRARAKLVDPRKQLVKNLKGE